MTRSNKIIESLESLSNYAAKPNFLFIGDSLMHAVSFNAFIGMLKDQGVRPIGVVCNTINTKDKPQFDGSIITALDDKDYVYLQNGVDFCHQETTIKKAIRFMSCMLWLKKQKLRHKSKQDGFVNPFYFVVPATGLPPVFFLELMAKHFSNVTIVILEEGLGTYTQTIKTWNKLADLSSAKKTSRLVAPLLSRAKGYLKEKSGKLLDECMPIFRFTMLKETNGSLLPDSTWVKYAREAFADLMDQFETKPLDYTDSVVVVGTIWRGASDLDIDYRITKELVERIREQGFKVIYRPHPRREDIGKYKGLRIPIDTNNHVPMESLFSNSNNRPLAIVGLFSSSQLSSQILWNIPALVTDPNCFNLVFAKHEDDPVIQFACESLKLSGETFASHVAVVQSLNELDDVLGHL